MPSHPETTDPIPPMAARDLFEAAFRASPDAVNINRLEDGMFVDINDGFEAMTGWTREAVMGRSSLDVDLWADPRDRERLVEGLRRDGGVSNLEARFRMRSGEVRWGLMSARVLTLGDVPHILSITRDITEPKEARERFEASQAHLNAVISAAPIVLWALDREGRFTLSAGSGLAAINLEPGQAKGESVFDLYRDNPGVLADVRRGLRGDRVSSTHEVGDRIFESRITPTFDEEGSVDGVIGVSQDVTQEARLHAQLQQAQKLEAIGRLAGGVAHDFNNLLTAIRGYGDLLAERLKVSNPMTGEALGAIHRDLEEIRRAGERATSLTGQLLAFSRKQILERKVLDLNRQVEQVERMLKRLIGEDIELISDLEPELAHIEADPSQLEQVIVNLAVNARDAMPDGGTLRVATRRVRLTEALSTELAEIPPGSYTVLSVSDSGCGIPHRDLPHIFEPFFTTKAQGKGTGLGLATVFGIVSQSGGHTLVESRPGQGTTFDLFFPSTTEDLLVETIPDPPVAVGGQETILLVEDEEAVRSLVAQVLSRKGYEVISTPEPREALARSRTREAPIHLLITDVIMPGKGGRELAKELTRERPGLPVLFISGYAGPDDPQAAFLEAGQEFLAKPFSPRGLARKVRQILDAAAEEASGT